MNTHNLVVVPAVPSDAICQAGEQAYQRKADDMASVTPTEFPDGGAIESAYHAMIHTGAVDGMVIVPQDVAQWLYDLLNKGGNLAAVPNRHHEIHGFLHEALHIGESV